MLPNEMKRHLLRTNHRLTQVSWLASVRISRYPLFVGPSLFAFSLSASYENTAKTHLRGTCVTVETSFTAPSCGLLALEVEVSDGA